MERKLQVSVCSPKSALSHKGKGAMWAEPLREVDALDECEGANNLRIILRQLTEARLLKKVRLWVLITSRPGVPIRYGFC